LRGLSEVVKEGAGEVGVTGIVAVARGVGAEVELEETTLLLLRELELFLMLVFLGVIVE
jgi:hypothetical protein